MESSPAAPRKSRRLSLARRILIGALLWSMLIVAGGVFAISAVYRAQTINLLDADLDSTLVTLARAIEPLDDDSGRIRDIEERHPSDPRFETPLSGQYWFIIAVDDDGALGMISVQEAFGTVNRPYQVIWWPTSYRSPVW